MTRIELTHRAIRDIAQIDRYSIETFGERVADRYIADIDRALGLLAEKPDLLQRRPELSGRLCFYRVRQHFLVCDIADDVVYVLTVIHGNMDLPERIGELEPGLIDEVELLRQRWLNGDA